MRPGGSNPSGSYFFCVIIYRLIKEFSYCHIAIAQVIPILHIL
nr:MAG TPA: hypothetical protein [Caudoviricetes sp.]